MFAAEITVCSIIYISNTNLLLRICAITSRIATWDYSRGSHVDVEGGGELGQLRATPSPTTVLSAGTHAQSEGKGQKYRPYSAGSASHPRNSRKGSPMWEGRREAQAAARS